MLSIIAVDSSGEMGYAVVHHALEGKQVVTDDGVDLIRIETMYVLYRMSRSYCKTNDDVTHTK